MDSYHDEAEDRLLSSTINLNPLDRVFASHDINLYVKSERNSGVIVLVIPDVGELKMSLAKAEDVAASLDRQAEYGRRLGSIACVHHYVMSEDGMVCKKCGREI